MGRYCIVGTYIYIYVTTTVMLCTLHYVDNNSGQVQYVITYMSAFKWGWADLGVKTPSRSAIFQSLLKIILYLVNVLIRHVASMH